MKAKTLLFSLLLIATMLAGCTEPGEESDTTIIDPVSGCTALLHIVETATHSPGNTSWTNHTYDSNCGEIDSTFTGVFDLDMGDYRIHNSTTVYNSAGDIDFMNQTSFDADNNGYRQYSNNTYYYDSNSLLLRIETTTDTANNDGPTGQYPMMYQNMSYDSSGRIIMVESSSASDGTYGWANTTYNLNGKIDTTSMATPSGISDVDGTITHYYDWNNINNILDYTITSSSQWSADPFYTNYTYDSQGRVTQLKSELAWGDIFINTSYDTSGQISEVTESWDTDSGNQWDLHYHYTRTYTWGQP